MQTVVVSSICAAALVRPAMAMLVASGMTPVQEPKPIAAAEGAIPHAPRLRALDPAPSAEAIAALSPEREAIARAAHGRATPALAGR
jgi:hypothetical protein